REVFLAFVAVGLLERGRDLLEAVDIHTDPGGLLQLLIAILVPADPAAQRQAAFRHRVKRQFAAGLDLRPYRNAFGRGEGVQEQTDGHRQISDYDRGVLPAAVVDRFHAQTVGPRLQRQLEG